MKPEEWLKHLSAAEAFLSLLGSAVIALVAQFLRIRRELRRAQVAMLSVPPSLPPDGADESEEPVDGEASLQRELWVREERIRSLSDELQTLGEDHARTAQTVTELTRQNARLRARVLELEQRRMLEPVITRKRPAAASPYEAPTLRPPGSKSED